MLGGREAVLFDLDGTLVDSVPDMADAIDRILLAMGRDPVGEDAVRGWVGNGARRLVTRALTGDPEAEADEALVDEALHRFLADYRQALCVRSHLYPGVREGLEALRRDGYRLACVTNKPEALAVTLLHQLNLSGLLPVVVGGDTTAERKPSALPLFHALRQLGCEADRAVMIGDSATDIAAARNAGVPVLCVPYGYNHGLDVRRAGADAIVDDIMSAHRLLKLQREGMACPISLG